MGAKLRESGGILNARSRAPLSYRHLRILGWLCLSVSQISVLLGLAIKLGVGIPHAEQWSEVLYQVGVIAVPLFLFANFAVILNGSKRYSSLLLMYSGFILGICAAYFFVVEHYIIGLLTAMGNREMTPREGADMILRSISPEGYFAFNVFIDLFLCTAFCFFMLAHPGKRFRGKKLLLFRAFALLPILYEVGSILLKAMTSIGRIVMPTWLFPLLTTKPPMMFLLFVGLVLIIKVRERHYEKEGKSEAQSEKAFRAYVSKRRFSLGLMAMMIVAALLDLLLKHLLPELISGFFRDEAAAAHAVHALGFGDAVMLVFLAPFALLISFSKSYENTAVDPFIPIVGVCLFAFVYVEGGYQLVCALMSQSGLGG